MHVNRIAVRLTAAALLVSTMATPAFALTGTVDAPNSVLRMRTEANTQSSVLKKLADGTQIEVLDTLEGSWYQISYSGLTGYVSSEYVKLEQEDASLDGEPAPLTEPPAAQAENTETEPVYVRVFNGPLNIRTGPGTDYDKVGQLATGKIVETLDLQDGWYQIDGSKDTGKDTDTDWYFFKDGRAKKASRTATDYRVNNDDGPVYVARIKVTSPKGGKEYFAFNEYGQMQTGLQYVPAERGFYYFDSNGYPVTGKVTNVECDDDTYEFYFNKNNGANAKGLNGEKSGYLYFNGKKLVADDDYRLYYYNGDVYLVNTKGKIQKTNRKYDIENSGIEHDKVDVTFRNNGTVKDISYENGSGTITLNDADLIYNTLLETSNGSSFNCDAEGKYSEKYVNIPYIQLYDDDVYTYDFRNVTVSNNTLNLNGVSEKWFDVNVSNTGTWR